MSNEKTELTQALRNATGIIPFTFMNDYMFHAILEDKKNEGILKALICACLHLKPEEISHIEVVNPIIQGEEITDKTFILDLNIVLNHKSSINMEMQVLNLGNWPERSLSYLCRNFDTLTKGRDYIDVPPAYHIGFLDFTLFPKHPEFFAKYQMMNPKNQNVLTSKFNLFVIDLSKINLATDEDRIDQLDHWARLFKAKTWEEIRMIANENPEMISATEELYKKNQDDAFALKCRARDEYYAIERYRENLIKEKDELLEKQAEELEKQAEELEKQAEELEKQAEELGKKDEEIRKLKLQLGMPID